ncbi:leucine-rich repeat domain-containing protein [Paludisphaera rhizosphaerae]|uniref:hypothetical protein n=1 Tax=Paludisphaera rhizosphaerae TaxID=2711216 RepID=UPI0013EB92BA|nr:hypothetical protein [Paludisphaera rhizosphaerae]
MNPDVDLRPANPDVPPAGEPSPPPRRPRRRLQALLALLAMGFAVSQFIQLDRTTVSRLGSWAESLYDTFHIPDPDAPSAAAERFKEEVRALGGSVTIQVVRPGLLGFIGRAETYEARFEGPKYDDAALARLAASYGSRISALWLHQTSITDDGLRHLEGMTNLSHLGIYYYPPGRGWPILQPKISDAGLAHLAKLPQLHSLDLHNVPITDAGLAVVKNLPSLSSLMLTRTEIQGPGLVHLQSHPTLSSLYISGDMLTDDGLKALAGVTSLQSLTLQDVTLPPEQLPLLLKLPRLTNLSLQGCGLLDVEVDALRKARPSLKIQN